MKVLMLNGSSHINGTTFTALNEIEKLLIMKELTMKYSRLVQMQ